MVDKATADRWALEDIETSGRPLERLAAEYEDAARRTQVPGVAKSLKSAAAYTRSRIERGPMSRALTAEARCEEAEQERDKRDEEAERLGIERAEAWAERDELAARCDAYERALRHIRDIAPRPVNRIAAVVLTGGRLPRWGGTDD